jgi:hypothetical protein
MYMNDMFLLRAKQHTIVQRIAERAIDGDTSFLGHILEKINRIITLSISNHHHHHRHIPRSLLSRVPGPTWRRSCAPSPRPIHKQALYIYRLLEREKKKEKKRNMFNAKNRSYAVICHFFSLFFCLSI